MEQSEFTGVDEGETIGIGVGLDPGTGAGLVEPFPEPLPDPLPLDADPDELAVLDWEFYVTDGELTCPVFAQF